jgi:hypothetical protein
MYDFFITPFHVMFSIMNLKDSSLSLTHLINFLDYLYI